MNALAHAHALLPGRTKSLTSVNPVFVTILASLSAGNGADDEKGLCPRCDRLGKWSVRQLERKILFASEETQQWPTHVRGVIADRPAQHWISELERVEHRTLRDLTFDAQSDFFPDLCQASQVVREDDPNHGRVWTSTDITRGRSRTIGSQLSPALADAYTCPPVVPKYTPHGSSLSIDMASRRTLT